MANAPFSQSFPESSEDEGDRCRSRIRMAARSLAQRSGPAITGNQVSGRLRAQLCSQGGVVQGLRDSLAGTGGCADSVDCWSQCIHHRLVSGASLGLAGYSAETSLKRLGELAAVHRVLAKLDVSHPGKECPEKSAGGASIDTEHSPAGSLEKIPEALSARAIRPIFHLLRCAQHGGPVIAIAADGIQFRQPLMLTANAGCGLGKHLRELRLSDIAGHGLDHHCFTKKGVSAGASHSAINSGSIRATSI